MRSLCITDTDVLPRWHQADRGRARARRGYHELAPEGAYSKITVWSGRQHWLTFVVPAAIAFHRDILREHQVSPALFRQWALVKSGYADPRTGRRTIVRPDVLASVLGCSTRQVERCNAAARAMKLEVVVLPGRMLTLEESWDARQRGSSQRGLSTEVALTIPVRFRRYLTLVTPTSGPARELKQSHLPHTYPHAASGEKKDAAPRRPQRTVSARTKRTLVVARDLRTRLDWLHDEQPGRLAGVLTRFVHADIPWTGADLALGVQARILRTGYGEIRAHTIRTRPAAVLAHLLTDVDPYADHPRLPELTPPPPPCTRTDCDGHGWIELANGRVTKCPDCPPTTRARHTSDGETSHQSPDDEPPF